MTDAPVGSDAWARRQDAIIAIESERDRQDSLWPGDDPGSGDYRPHLLTTILTEEVGEVANAVLEERQDWLRVELIQVAAVCVKWLEFLDSSGVSKLKPPPPPLRFDKEPR